jgi:class 3 adenylate cyclase
MSVAANPDCRAPTFRGLLTNHRRPPERAWLGSEAFRRDHALVQSLPTGTVTFLFTDIEGSTQLLRELGAEGYARALAQHREVLTAAVERHRGSEVDTQGDAFFVAFSRAGDAIAAAADAQRRLASCTVRVRMGIHTREPLRTESLP